ncbi:hypothetical protein CPB84DRAFT_153443 [Gymnopilus junonius]|uniref:Uncharacterized protein n=1 Tax=Gymnopilus junonius TaxID=109634 RepID=A0A9P5TJC0_GYMJU|nr:hypothetical protein CPB84DRAFT_153443 [Gymnopilus junonius]
MHRAKDLTVDLGILDRLQLLDKSLFDDIMAKAQPAPQLTKLSLRVADNVVPFPPILSTSWSPAPFLRSLLLNGAAGVVLDDVLGLKTSQFPFHQLTTLEIDTNVSIEAFFSLLSTTPSLQSGIFKKIEGEAPAEDSTATPICLPFLQVLQMGGDCWETEECPPLMDLLPFINARSSPCSSCKRTAGSPWMLSKRSFKILLASSNTFTWILKNPIRSRR